MGPLAGFTFELSLSAHTKTTSHALARTPSCLNVILPIFQSDSFTTLLKTVFQPVKSKVTDGQVVGASASVT